MRKSSSNILIAFIFIACSFQAFAQNEISDIELIKTQNFQDSKYDKRKVSFIFTSSKNPIVRYNPVNLTFGTLLYFYQKVLSPQLSTKCTYEISCSNFSKGAIKEYGLIKGIALSADRLMRCTPLAAIDIHKIDIDIENQKIKDNLSQYHLYH